MPAAFLSSSNLHPASSYPQLIHLCLCVCVCVCVGSERSMLCPWLITVTDRNGPGAGLLRLASSMCVPDFVQEGLHNESG